MKEFGKANSLILGISLIVGLALLGFLLADAALKFKQLDRNVTVKGLAEREVQANIVIWPIQFSAATNDLQGIYQSVETSTQKIVEFLLDKGLARNEISFSTPQINDKSANQYAGGPRPEFRYSALQTVTVYSENISLVRTIMGQMAELGKSGIAFTGDTYAAQTEYLFTQLNEIKPEMIEEATRKAREVAQKFASDSDSSLGKIKRASQGQFSISARDKNNPHIKKIRVVSTVAYYLSD
jgi:hypothetical protein